MANYGMPYSSDISQSYQHSQPYQQQPQPFTPPSGGQIAPGSITYTTSTGPEGRVVYHPFKAVPASYQTPSGVVTGIQWVPAEATQILPAGAQPANAEFAASWNRGYLSRDDQKALKEWQRDEEKRRKKEEKESSKRLREKERQAREDELRKARDRDAARMRRPSFNQGNLPSGVGSGGYGPGSYAGYDRDSKYSASGGVGDLDRRFGDMGLDRSDYDRERDASLGRPRKYSMSDPNKTRGVSGNFDDRSNPYGPGSYPSTNAGYPSTTATGPYSPTPLGGAHSYPGTGTPYNPAGASPNMRSAQFTNTAGPGYPSTGYPSSPGRSDPYARSTSPFPGAGNSGVYPRGHILEGQPIPPRSRATTPVPGSMPGGGGPGMPFPSSHTFPQPNAPGVGGGAFPGDSQQLAAPEGFSRPINAAQPYTPFETMKIQNMDDFAERIPRMPLVLQPHDVYHEDWIRFMQDLALAWGGKLPVPELVRGGRPPKRSTLAGDLIDLWNGSFFIARGVEVVLYKGRERRSGPGAGVVDIQLLDDEDSLSSASSTSEDSELSGDDRYGQGGYGLYGRQVGTQTYEALEAKRKRRERKAEKKRRSREKKNRRKAKERESKYALYLTCVPQGGPGSVGGVPGGYTGAQGGVSGVGGGYGGMGGIHSGAGVRSGRTSPMPGGYGAVGGRTSPMPGGYGGVGGRTSPMPGGYGAMGGRTDPTPGGYGGPMGGRTSPMPGGYGGAMGGRTSPMPGGYGAIGGRIDPTPGGYGGPIGGRTSPMPGGYGGPMGGRTSPMPGGYGGPMGGRTSPMPGGYGGIGGRMSPMPGGPGRPGGNY